MCRHEKEMEIEQEPIEVAGSSKETTPVPEELPAEEAEPDADKIKEQGNAAFKAGRYQDAIDYYSRAIGTLLRPLSRSGTRILPPFSLVLVLRVPSPTRSESRYMRVLCLLSEYYA